MIDVASRATHGVKIPGRKATRAEIIRTFKNHLTRLRDKLNVSSLSWHMFRCNLLSMLQSDSVRGAINTTFDGWQADNTDGYFAVTGHWIEENYPGQWECETALFGFTKVNNAHSGRRLGGILYRILDRLGIAHRVRMISYNILSDLHLNLARSCHMQQSPYGRGIFIVEIAFGGFQGQLVFIKIPYKRNQIYR